MSNRSLAIGIVLEHFDLRSDIREIISQLSSIYKVVVFGKSADSEKFNRHIRDGVEFREIRENLPSQGNFIKRLYTIFKKIPKSRQNYFLMQEFKLQSLPKQVKRKARLQIELQKVMPKVMDYDYYLERLPYSGKTKIADLDHIIFLTEVASDELLARVIAEGRSASIYVASWDHPCKHTSYTTKLMYDVWCEGIAEDLMELQGIPREKIRISGAGQLAYVEQFVSGGSGCKETKVPQYKFLYFACSIGITDLVPKEIKLIEGISKMLKENFSDWKLIVRPYPILNAWEMYNPLRLFSNIILDDEHRAQDYSIAEEAIWQKYAMLAGAKAFLHVGTTMGLEGSFLDTPSLLIDYGHEGPGPGVTLYNFIHQYQIEKYMMRDRNGVINSISELKKIMLILDSGEDKYNSNASISRNFPLRSFSEIVRHFESVCSHGVLKSPEAELRPY